MKYKSSWEKCLINFFLKTQQYSTSYKLKYSFLCGNFVDESCYFVLKY